MTLRLAAAAVPCRSPSAAPLPRGTCSRGSLRSGSLLRPHHASPLPLRHLRQRLLRTAGSTAAGAGEEGKEAEAAPAAAGPSANAAEPGPASSSAAASSSSMDAGSDAAASTSGDAAGGEGLDGLLRAARLSFAATKLEMAKTEAAKLDVKREAARAEAAQAEAELEALQVSGGLLRLGTLPLLLVWSSGLRSALLMTRSDASAQNRPLGCYVTCPSALQTAAATSAAAAPAGEAGEGEAAAPPPSLSAALATFFRVLGDTLSLLLRLVLVEPLSWVLDRMGLQALVVQRELAKLEKAAAEGPLDPTRLAAVLHAFNKHGHHTAVVDVSGAALLCCTLGAGCVCRTSSTSSCVWWTCKAAAAVHVSCCRCCCCCCLKLDRPLLSALRLCSWWRHAAWAAAVRQPQQCPQAPPAGASQSTRQ